MFRLNCSLAFLLFLLLSVFTSSCAFRHVDGISYFFFTGRVFDAENKFSLEGVSMFFIDTGFDSERSRHQRTIKITQSGSDGKINYEYNYWWGSEEGIFIPNPKMTFSILLRKDGYEERRIDFAMNDYTETDKGFKVDLGEIYLVKN